MNIDEGIISITVFFTIRKIDVGLIEKKAVDYIFYVIKKNSIVVL